MNLLLRIEPAYVEQTFKAMMSQSKQTNSRQKWFYLLVVLLILFLIILVVIIAYCVRRLCKKRREKVLEYPPDAEQTEKGNVEKEQPVTTTKLQSDELDTISNDTARSSIEAEAKPDSLNGNSFVNSEASLTNPVSSNGGEINNDSDATDTTVQEDNENSTKYVNLKNLNTNNNNNNNISRMMVKAMSATRPPVELKSVNMALNDEVAVFDMMARKRDESSKEVKVNYHKNCRSNNPSSSSQTVKADSGFIKKKLSSLNSSLKHQKQ
jgi:cytoskeletal protein RodZ